MSSAGAERSDWMHFAEKLKLRPDLLPVVSNPDAPIAFYSRMKDKGKTPSRYNKDREVHGIAQWTQVSADAKDVRRWSSEPDYGICIQTRFVRAIDIDVTDPYLASEIVKAVRETVPGVHFPRRYRQNSSKCLLVFQYDGELFKRSFPTSAGRVELLATGQQFIAVGLHPSGARYEWEGGLPEGIPILNETEVEAVWSALDLCFATGEGQRANSTRERVRSGQEGEDTLDDEVAVYLAEHGLVIENGPGGQLYFECPWTHEHSSDSGPSATTYFPAGTGSFEQGHFKCLHDHCTGRTDDDFRQAIGYNDDIEFRARDFPSLPMNLPVPSVPGLEHGADLDEARSRTTRWLEKKEFENPLFRKNTQGFIEVIFDNIVKAVACPPFITRKIRFDEFQSAPVWAWWDEADDGEDWKLWSDVDNARLRFTLDRRDFKSTPGIMDVRAAVDEVGRRNPVDTAILWLNNLQWDGVPRIDTYMRDYLGTEDTPYTRAIGAYMWTALAGRCLRPGIKADMAIILITPKQGRGKTTMVEAVVPNDDWFGEIDLTKDDDDLGRLMRGKLVCELSELKGLGSRDLESIKAFISRRIDRWTPKYKEYSEAVHRRCVFIGTANEDEILNDPSGERRWLPTRIGRADVEAIQRDRELLWAEGRDRFRKSGIAWQDAEALAEAEHHKFKKSDPLEDKVRVWLGTPTLGGYVPGEQPHLTLEDVVEQCLGREFAKCNVGEQRRFGGILRALGYVSQRVRVDGLLRRLWVKQEENGDDE